MSLALSQVELIDSLRQYASGYKEELNFRDAFLNLLQHKDAYQRWHMPGHITCSAWILNENHNKVLLIHHKKLNRWLQPGGHADGDENIFNVAIKEAQEETGVQEFKLLQETIFDLDIHPIPERADMPAHDHYDIRLLFSANEKDALLLNEEVNQIAWFSFDEVVETCGRKANIERMLEKCLKK
jgi:8-oxo-dGTP pyrophosphatase MutT (NUDIX family)